MRWKIKIWIVIAIAAACYGQNINIDLNLDQNGSPNGNRETTKESTLTPVTTTLKDDLSKNEIDDDDADASVTESEETDSATEASRSQEGSISNEGETESTETTVTVETEHGEVKGYPWKDSPDIMSYIDIPYGKIGNLFEEPSEPVEQYTIDNTEHNKLCPQLKTIDAVVSSDSDESTESTLEVIGELNCLTLSVFAPKDAENASVLFHIHDGNFVSGSGDPLIYGPEYLVSKGLILVLPNYRLGPLGFLCLQNDIAPGNAALKDLSLALKWTKQNIAAFGGNPNNIVVSGEGSSGALAGYLVLSPVSREFISKVITESGSVISHWAIDRYPNETATILEEKIREFNSSATFSDDFFHDIDMEMLLTATYGVQFRPCIDNYTNPFMTQTPWYILQEEEIDIPFMIGSASGAGLHQAINQDDHSLSSLNEHFGSILPDDLVFEGDEEEKIAKKVKNQYFGDDAIAGNDSKELSEYFTDALYLGPVVRTARVLVKAGATVYFYEFAFVGDLNKELAYLGEQAKALNVAARGDIVGYLFTQNGHSPEAGSGEEGMVKLMTDLWINFIENGKPAADGIEWKELVSTKDPENEEWLLIGSEPEPMKGIHVDRLRLWSEIYDAHFIERNVGRAIKSQYPAFAVAAIYLLGIVSRSFR